ncbi:hypothetical protein SAMN04488122_6635 [Chitinophaga arvensicola]|uniref:Uncharacterized protein n=1 Tax=Chitinophaga arvensicola TaxID=29529 RepID=A0A1I0SDL4_9BACT|nr:hypothetical protein SAMN04488122_6635 [Chitinophaga arvensicola]
MYWLNNRCRAVRTAAPVTEISLIFILKTRNRFMNIGQQILFFISILGAFNGVVLSLYLALGKKRRSVAAIFQRHL